MSALYTCDAPKRAFSMTLLQARSLPTQVALPEFILTSLLARVILIVDQDLEPFPDEVGIYQRLVDFGIELLIDLSLRFLWICSNW